MMRMVITDDTEEKDDHVYDDMSIRMIIMSRPNIPTSLQRKQLDR